MSYIPKNVDVKLVLKEIENINKNRKEDTELEIQKLKSFQDGVEKGLNIAEAILKSREFEKEEEPTYEDGVIDFIYELGKEFDILTSDIRENFTSIDDACIKLKEKIENRKENEESPYLKVKMDIPKNCAECKIRKDVSSERCDDYSYCPITDNDMDVDEFMEPDSNRPEGCPLIKD